jgi:hypothetical protein
VILGHLSATNQAALTGRAFFPQLIAGPFQAGLHTALTFAIAACLVAAVASRSRGRRYVAEAPAAAAPDRETIHV